MGVVQNFTACCIRHKVPPPTVTHASKWGHTTTVNQMLDSRLQHGILIDNIILKASINLSYAIHSPYIFTSFDNTIHSQVTFHNLVYLVQEKKREIHNAFCGLFCFFRRRGIREIQQFNKSKKITKYNHNIISY